MGNGKWKFAVKPAFTPPQLVPVFTHSDATMPSAVIILAAAVWLAASNVSAAVYLAAANIGAAVSNVGASIAHAMGLPRLCVEKAEVNAVF